MSVNFPNLLKFWKNFQLINESFVFKHFCFKSTYIGNYIKMLFYIIVSTSKFKQFYNLSLKIKILRLIISFYIIFQNFEDVFICPVFI